MIRICHVLQTAALHGVSRALLETLQRLDRSRFEPHLVLPAPGPLARSCRKLGVPCHYVPPLRGAFWRRPRAATMLKRLFCEQGFEVVHAHSGQAERAALRAAARAGVPHRVHHVRQSPQRAAPWGLRRWNDGTQQRAARDGERVVFANSEQRRTAIAAGLPAEQCLTIYNGVDLERFHPQRRRPCRADLGLADEELIIACATSLEPHKQPLLLADVAAAVHRRVGADCPWKLWVLGSGSQRGRMLRRAARLGIEKRLRWIGWHEQPQRVLPAVDVMISPALSAGLPLSLLEGLACGVPLVASDIPGHRDIVTDDTGFLCDPRDAPEFAGRLARLMLDRHLRQRMGRRARKRARDHFDAERTSSAVQRLYDILCAPARPRLWRAAA